MNFQLNIDNRLGEGQIGTIYEAYEGQRKICAKVIKDYDIDIELKQNIQNQLNIIMNANHSNIVKVYQVLNFTNEEIEQIIYMEHCESGNLQTYLQNHILQLEEAVQKMNQILQGLQFLQQQGINTDNIKLNNILIDKDGNIKLSDLWFVPFVRNHDTQKFDQVYLSPQILGQKPYTDKKNIYALGIIFYYIAYKSFPYERNKSGIFFNENKSNLFRCPPILLIGDKNKKQELQVLIESMLKFEEAQRIDWNQLFQYPLFQSQPFQTIFNSLQEEQDQQILKITREDQNSIIQYDAVESITNNIFLVSLQLSQNLLDLNPQETIQKKINIVSVSSISSNNSNKSSSIKLIPKQEIKDSMLMSNQTNKMQMHQSNQNTKLSKADRIAKIIQIDLAKQKIVEQGIQLLRKNQLPIRDLYVYALIVALSGYKSNLLVNSIGFAYNSPQHINQKIFEEFDQDPILEAIKEFSESNIETHKNLKNSLYEMSYESSNQYSEDYRLFSSCLDLENDRLDALDQLAVPKQNRGMYTPYYKYMEQIKFIYEKYVKECLIHKYQEKNKIILINPEIKILATLKYICNLENAFNFKKYYNINPEDIKIDDTQFINML
ncbi:hypothetical protein pb186bvf_015738 [Paramecium bursaria]